MDGSGLKSEEGIEMSNVFTVINSVVNRRGPRPIKAPLRCPDNTLRQLSSVMWLLNDPPEDTEKEE